MNQSALLAIPSLLLASCGGAIPLLYPQTAPIPSFSGRVHGCGAAGAWVQVQGHPETGTTADRHGSFVTQEGADFYFGMDQAYFPRSYQLTAFTSGKIHKKWPIVRPPLIGHYQGQPGYSEPIELGRLR